MRKKSQKFEVPRNSAEIPVKIGKPCGLGCVLTGSILIENEIETGRYIPKANLRLWDSILCLPANMDQPATQAIEMTAF